MTSDLLPAPGPGRRFVTERFIRPIQAFAAIEASSGILLLAAAVLAIAWANSPWDDAYFDLWNAEFELDANRFVIHQTLGHLVNDGLMAIFFFMVGLEIKRELLHGELASVRRATLPAVAALGGMVVPALIYTAFNAGTDTSKGWGIPMATDIAFAVGVLTLVGRRVPFSLKVFLLALAIVDDLGAIVVIAVFYTESIHVEPLLWGGLVVLIILGLRTWGVRSTDVYVALGILFWVAIYESGIHATIAGVILAFLTPASPLYSRREFERHAPALLERYEAARGEGDHEAEAAAIAELERLSRDTVSPLERLEHTLHPWVSFLIVPIFALANAGVVVDGDSVSAAFDSAATAGVFFGLVLGKPIGILLFSYIAVRLGLASMPANASVAHFAGVGILAGIGFTVSLFITGLSFDSAIVQQEAKMGVLAASAVAGILGFVYLWLVPAPRTEPLPEPARTAGREIPSGAD